MKVLAKTIIMSGLVLCTLPSNKKINDIRMSISGNSGYKFITVTSSDKDDLGITDASILNVDNRWRSLSPIKVKTTLGDSFNCSFVEN
ncbi:MAG: hypothetical protein AMJ43_07880 [Coxiella sp. DG_40]|nr:MAG: hypothetical protein AMJ43_07880 [Coxiella sp. DG_40]